MKNYKILRVCPSAPYQKLFSEFFFSHQLGQLSYDQAIYEFCRFGYLIPGSWSECMRKLGNQSIDVLPDFMPLQKKWAEENGISESYNNQSWQIPLFFKQIEKIKPDVVFIYAGAWWFLPDDLRKQLKQRFPFIKIVTGLWGDTLGLNEDYSKFQGVDVLFCAYEYLLNELEACGISAKLSGNCFDPLIHETLKQEENTQENHDFIFAGSSGYGFNNHKNRYFDLKTLIENIGLKIWGYEPNIEKHILKHATRDTFASILGYLPDSWLSKFYSALSQPGFFVHTIDRLFNTMARSDMMSGNKLQRLVNEARKPSSERYPSLSWNLSLKPLKKLFPKHCFPPKFGAQYFKLLENSRIVFNRHTDEDNHAGNIRMFEVTGMGSCLITDKPMESSQHFELDEEIVTYSSIDECLEKVNFLMNNEGKRKEIAIKGKRRTLRDHTVMNRCIDIHETLQNII